MFAALTLALSLLITPAAHPAHDICLTDTTTCVQAEDGSWVNTGYYDEAPVTVEAAPVTVEAAPVTVEAAPVTVEAVEPSPEWAAYAWVMFDLYGADLLPDTETTVTLTGISPAPFTVDAQTITVWDSYGNHFLFEVQPTQ